MMKLTEAEFFVCVEKYAQQMCCKAVVCPGTYTVALREDFVDHSQTCRYMHMVALAEQNQNK